MSYAGTPNSVPNSIRIATTRFDSDTSWLFFERPEDSFEGVATHVFDQDSPLPGYTSGVYPTIDSNFADPQEDAVVVHEQMVSKYNELGYEVVRQDIPAAKMEKMLIGITGLTSGLDD